MADPLVLIANKEGREYQVLKSAFHRLYEADGYAITAIVGGVDDTGAGIPEAPETTTANVAPASPAELELVADAPVASNPAELAPLEPVSDVQG
jgi:hypothetical protein